EETRGIIPGSSEVRQGIAENAERENPSPGDQRHGPESGRRRFVESGESGGVGRIEASHLRNLKIRNSTFAPPVAAIFLILTVMEHYGTLQATFRDYIDSRRRRRRRLHCPHALSYCFAIAPNCG